MPQTIADGLRTPVGLLNFPIIKQHVRGIITVSEEVRRCFLLALLFTLSSSHVISRMRHPIGDCYLSIPPLLTFKISRRALGRRRLRRRTIEGFPGFGHQRRGGDDRYRGQCGPREGDAVGSDERVMIWIDG